MSQFLFQTDMYNVLVHADCVNEAFKLIKANHHPICDEPIERLEIIENPHFDIINCPAHILHIPHTPTEAEAEALYEEHRAQGEGLYGFTPDMGVCQWCGLPPEECECQGGNIFDPPKPKGRDPRIISRLSVYFDRGEKTQEWRYGCHFPYERLKKHSHQIVAIAKKRLNLKDMELRDVVTVDLLK